MSFGNAKREMSGRQMSGRQNSGRSARSSSAQAFPQRVPSGLPAIRGGMARVVCANFARRANSSKFYAETAQVEAVRLLNETTFAASQIRRLDRPTLSPAAA